MTPLVSVILPTYNRLQYLRPAIESVFVQTLKDWELIIADDGSDTPVKEYLTSLIEPERVKVLFLDHTGNPSKARNAALREARGQWIAFQDSDDLWMPRKLELQMESLQRHPSRLWSHTKYVLVDSNGNPTPWMVHTGGRSTPEGWIIDKVIHFETLVAVQSVVVSRKLLEQIGGFDEGLLGSEHIDLFHRLALASEIDAVVEPLTLMRRHEAGHFSSRGAEGFRCSAMATAKALRTPGLKRFRPVLLRKRAMVAGGWARAHASEGHRMEALKLVLSTLRYTWRQPTAWRDVLAAVALACSPPAVRQIGRTLLRRYRT